jgi:hypothetical protein
MLDESENLGKFEEIAERRTGDKPPIRTMDELVNEYLKLFDDDFPVC